MRAVFLFASALLISIGCVSGQTTELGANINNSTDYPDFPEASTISDETTPKNVTTTEIPTTSIDPNSTTTSTTSKTTTTVVPPPPTTKSTTPEPPKPTDKPVTTEAPHSTTPEPSKERHFDGASFLGGIILAVGLMAIGLVVFKFYKARAERNYHTL